MVVAPGWTLALALAGAIPWQPVRPGLERAEYMASRSGPLSRVRVIALRLDPCRIRLDFATRTRDLGSLGAWTIDSLPPEAVLAFNAGQFRSGAPWGWWVQRGEERQPPGTGALGMALTIDSTGRVALRTPDEIATHPRVDLALQSYPTLLVDGALPTPLRAPNRGVDLEHRDSRLAIGVTRDGRVVLALTRFEAVAGVGSTLPYGPTIPELAALMRDLGAVRALGLDGGLSSQMALRQADGTLARWSNWRWVPMGVVGRPVDGCR